MSADFSKILDILNRRQDVAVLPALIQAVKANVATADLRASAIILDANAILRIPGHRKSSDIIDYLESVHQKPILVPGQIVQEFWNNQLAAVSTVYKTILAKVNDLDKEVLRALSLESDSELMRNEPTA